MATKHIAAAANMQIPKNVTAHQGYMVKEMETSRTVIGQLELLVSSPACF